MTVATQQRSPHAGFRHRALLYEGTDDLVASAVPFIRDGICAGEPVLVSVVSETARALRDALGSQAEQVQFHDMAVVGRNPARIIALWQRFLDENSSPDVVGARGIGEPIWPDRRAAEIVECQIHEALLNIAFDNKGPNWKLLCPYNTGGLPAEVIDSARRTHPVLSQRSCHWTSSQYAVEADATLREPLSDPPEDAIAISFRIESVDRVRRHVRRHAAETGIGDRAPDLEVAAHELAISCLRYGDGNGTLRYWDDAEACIVEVGDCGRVDDALIGRICSTIGDDRGHTLWLVNQFCDLVQVRSSAKGTTVRVRVWR